MRMILATAIGLWSVACMAAPSLLRNGGFERDTAWTIGQYTVLTREGARTGSRCLRADGARGAAVEQTVWSVQPGRTYTVSGWVRTQEIVPQAGGFTFLALYEHDAAGRIVRFIDFAKVTGTTDWTEYRHTTQLAPTTEYVVVKAGTHSALGTAWFDDMNLVEGAQAALWQETPASQTSPRGYRAAILDDPSLPIVGARTPAATFRQALAADGVPITSLSAAQLAGGALSPDRFDLLIVPTGATFPVEARKPLLAFLMAGGDLLCTGGYAFDHLVTRKGSAWEPYRRYLDRASAEARAHPLPNGGFEEGLAGWEPEGPACTIDQNVASSGRASGRVRFEATGAGGRWTAVLPVEPGRAYLVGAKARCENVHGSHYAFLAVYQYGEDGKLLEFKDFAQMTGTQDWKRHESRIVIHPAAKRVTFHAGLYLAAGTLWIDDVTCAPLPIEERINTHFGEPMDGLVLTPVQLTLFSPDQRLGGAKAVGVFPGWKPLQISGPFRGYDATAQLRQNARWQPLVEARDAFGRMTGAVGSLVTFGSGPFGGSRWALFGIENRDVFAGPAGAELLRRIVRLLRHDVAARTLTTDYAIYDRGETARLTLALHSPRGRSTLGGALTAELRLDAPGRSAATLHQETRNLAAGSTLPTEPAFTWKVSAQAPDFVRASVTLKDPQGNVIDHIETGFCVRDTSVVASGPSIRYRDNAFDLQFPNKPATRTTLFGTDTYGNMLLSPSCDPLTWFRDLRAMRDHGLHMYENLQYPPTGWKYTEAEWRKMDALIQLSQRFGLPYMAGLLIGVDVAIDDATLAAQAAMCRSFAERYRHVPGLIYYLNGDFRLDMKDVPDLRRIWNEMLRERYGDNAALRAAWGEEAVAEPLGSIAVAEYVSAKPFSVRARDVKLFQAALVRRWVTALTSAIREVDTVHPITSEYYQRPYVGIDLRLTMDGMDAANFGYFGAPREDIAQLLATIKWNDMRRAGKSINIGEFGVKTHDAWAQERDPFGYHIGRTEEEQRRQLWWIVHAALAYDVTKIQNWCWADDPDGVFPWGVAYNNPLRPKPVLQLWRNLRLVSELMPHAFTPADAVFVMPDSWRLGAPDPASWRWVANALECLLATRARFDVINEDMLAGLDPAPRVVVAPFASQLPQAVQERLLELARRGATVYVADPPPGGLLTNVPMQGSRTDGWLDTNFMPGRLMVPPKPWEALPSVDVFVQSPEATQDGRHNLYGMIYELSEMAAPRTLRGPGVWRGTVRTAGERTLLALFPRTDPGRGSRVEASHDKLTVAWEGLQGAWPCLVVTDPDMGVLAATGRGRLLVNGREVASGKGPWMAASLDGMPISKSRRLAISMTNGGSLHLACGPSKATAQVVEMREGNYVPIGQVTVRATPTGWEVEAGADDLVVVTKP